ncbi:GNAT family N-acetyltransferase [Fusibacter sp. JL216-2]|uniref:GNAT family N-acetyltransferase n=1 Tax=Fusibacter sp. JL216-2 TaxID=3071453 RepID=UPI003D34F4CA
MEFEFDYFPVIETDRLIMREINLEDLGALYKIFSSETVMKYYGMFPINELKQAENLILSFRDGFDEEKSIRWGITLKESQVFIGTCGFHNMQKRNYRAEIGYELSADHWNRGYITEAIGAMLEFGFGMMGLNRIEALVYPENTASHKALEGLGFKEEGLLREYAYFRERFQDLVMHSLLRNEYVGLLID